MSILTKLFGGGSKPDPQHQKEIAAAEKGEDVTFTTKHGSQGVKNYNYAEYVRAHKDLLDNYNKHWKRGAPDPYSSNNEGISMAEYGAMHWHQTGRKEGRAFPGAESSHYGGGGSGSSGGGSSGDRTASYGTTNPQAGNTGSKELDKSTEQMLGMMSSLTALIAAMQNRTASPDEKEEVSKTPGSGLSDTILTQTYLPSKEKRKKSYLTPISVG